MSPVPDVEVVQWPESGAFRVERKSADCRFASISPTDAKLPAAGSRFDVPGGEVLYAATAVEGCFGETLARFRPSPRIMDAVKHEKGYMNAGTVPAQWRFDRRIIKVDCISPLPFLDVDATATCTALTSQLAPIMTALGIDQPLDISLVRGKNRQLTRAIAEWAYTLVDSVGNPCFSGIRYTSRLGSQWECWSIFQGTDIKWEVVKGIELADTDLRNVVGLYGLNPM